jgi:hypothetical protein
MATVLSKQAFTDETETKPYLKISGNADDDLLRQLINRATAVILSETRRKMKYSPTAGTGIYTSTTTPKESILDGTGTPSLFLPQYPVQSIQLVKVRDTTYSTWVTLLAGDYIFDAGTGRLLMASAVPPVAGVWPDWPQSVWVDFKAGYDFDNSTDPDPDVYALKGFTWDAVRFWYLNRTNNPMVQSESSQPYSYTKRRFDGTNRHGLPAEIVAALGPYIKPLADYSTPATVLPTIGDRGWN